jgi:hypothetical protein
MSRRPEVVSLLAGVLLFCPALGVAAGAIPSILLSTQVLDTTCLQNETSWCALDVTASYKGVQSGSLSTGSTEETIGGDSFELSAGVHYSLQGLGWKGCTGETWTFDVKMTVSICSVSRPEWAVGSVLVVEISGARDYWYKHTECKKPHYFSDSRSLPLQFTMPEGTSTYPDSLFSSWYSVTDWEGGFLFPDTAGYLCGAGETASPERSVENRRAILLLSPGSLREGGFLGAFTVRLGSGGFTSAYRVTLRLPPQ